LFALSALAWVVNACASPPVELFVPPPPPEPIVLVREPLVLVEIKPRPREVIVAPQASALEPVYNIFKIVETTEVNGVQKYVLVRPGNDKTNIAVGTTGDISSAEAFTELIGTYKIIEVFANFFRCEIVSLNRRIGSTAFIRVRIGEKQKDAP
jgi:hypothetical protein